MSKRANILVIASVSIMSLIIITQTVLLYKMYRQQETRITQLQNPEPEENKLQKKAEQQTASAEDDFFSSFDMNSWNPFTEMQRMQSKVDQMFQNSLGRFRSSSGFQDLFRDEIFSPDIDIKDKGDRYVIKLDMPGLDKSDIQVSLNDRVLTVSGTRKYEKNNKNDNMLRQERYQGQFNRSVTIPGPVKESTMKAEYKDGVLVVSVDKQAESKEEKQIQVY